MEVFQAVRTVLATRSYTQDPIPDNLVSKILQAARLTGSSMNRHPWHFIVVDQREDLEKLGALAATGPYIAEAGMALAVAIEDTRYAVSDASRAIQSMILTAWSEGVSSNWVGFFGLEEAADFLGSPDSLDLLALVPFGYTDRDELQGEKDRKPFEEIVHYQRFGQPKK